MDARNTFEAPESVEPQTIAVELENGALAVGLPAKSVTVITLKP
jgi:alpha-N-arabinofuranosidase